MIETTWALRLPVGLIARVSHETRIRQRLRLGMPFHRPRSALSGLRLSPVQSRLRSRRPFARRSHFRSESRKHAQAIARSGKHRCSRSVLAQIAATAQEFHRLGDRPVLDSESDSTISDAPEHFETTRPVSCSMAARFSLVRGTDPAELQISESGSGQNRL